MDLHELPGSAGEHFLQVKYCSTSRARAFYQKQMLDHLNPLMRRFIVEQEMVFLASADSRGECDCSFRAGENGFIRILDERTLIYPEYRGNGVRSSLGNIVDNPHVALLFLDFFRDGIGLHVNGRASLWSRDELLRTGRWPADGPQAPETGTACQAELWVLVEIDEAYIHCSKHIPLLVKRSKEIDWETDDVRKKGGDYFHAKGCSRPWSDSPVSDTEPG